MTISTQERRSLTLILTLACMALVAGCYRSAKPLFDYGPEGGIIQMKRIARVSQGGTFIRVGKTAYDQNHRGLKASSVGEQAILEEYGQPDYIRRPFRSTRGDLVGEWAYLQKNKLFQMVHHKVAYEGPLSDKERVLIQHGYPNIHLLQQDDLGNSRETFIYRNEWDTRQKYYSFKDDEMILGKTAY